MRAWTTICVLVTQGDPRFLLIPYPLTASYTGPCSQLHWLSVLGQPINKQHYLLDLYFRDFRQKSLERRWDMWLCCVVCLCIRLSPMHNHQGPVLLKNQVTASLRFQIGKLMYVICR